MSLASLQEKLKKLKMQRKKEETTDTEELTDTIDHRMWVKKIEQMGNPAIEWLHYTNYVLQNVQFDTESSRNDFICSIFSRAVKAISGSGLKCESYARLFVNYANFVSQIDADDARDLFCTARSNLRRYAIVHVYAAQFEFQQGNKEKCRKIFDKAYEINAEPRELLDIANKKFLLGHKVLITEEELLKFTCSTSTQTTQDLSESKYSEMNISLDSGIGKSESTENMSEKNFKFDLPVKSRTSRRTGSNSSDDTAPLGVNLDDAFTRPSARKAAAAATVTSSLIKPPPARRELLPSVNDSINSTEASTALKDTASDNPLVDKPFQPSNHSPVEGTVSFNYPEKRKREASGVYSDECDTVPLSFDSSQGNYNRPLRSSHSTPDCKNASVISVSTRKRRFIGQARRTLETVRESGQKVACTQGQEHDDHTQVSILRPMPDLDASHTQEMPDDDTPLERNISMSSTLTSSTLTVMKHQDESHSDTESKHIYKTPHRALSNSHPNVNSSRRRTQGQRAPPMGEIPPPDLPRDNPNSSEEKSPTPSEPIPVPAVPSPPKQQQPAPIPVIQEPETVNPPPPPQPQQSASQPLQPPPPQPQQPASQPLQTPPQPQQPPLQPQQPASQPSHHQTPAQTNDIPCPFTPSAKQHIEVINGKQYSVLNCIGRGGTSCVYVVLDAGNDMYAVKIIDMTGADEGTVQSYKNEIALLKRLQGSDRVITMFDYEFNVRKRKLYVVMEKGDTDLATLFARNKRLNKSMILYYWQEMLEAVKVLHKAGIVHTDLKPANFLLVAGHLKLIDFGIAKAIQQDMTSVTTDQQVGTLNFMSPEALMADSVGDEYDEHGQLKRKHKIGYKSDVWSLGCILYRMVYGYTPFQSIRNQLQKMKAIINPEHLIKFPEKNTDRYLREVLELCLVRDPHKRPSIQYLLDHQSLTKPKVSTPPPVANRQADLLRLMQQLAADSPRSFSSLVQNAQGLLTQVQGETSTQENPGSSQQLKKMTHQDVASRQGTSSNVRLISRAPLATVDPNEHQT